MLATNIPFLVGGNIQLYYSLQVCLVFLVSLLTFIGLVLNIQLYYSLQVKHVQPPQLETHSYDAISTPSWEIQHGSESKSATADETREGPRSATRATGQRRQPTPIKEGRSLGNDWFKRQEPNGRTAWSPNYVDNEVKRGEKTLDLEPAKPEVELLVETTDGKHTEEHGHAGCTRANKSYVQQFSQCGKEDSTD